MGFFSRNKKGVSYKYKTATDETRAARHLITNLNTGKIDLGGRTYVPGQNTMLPDENGVPVFVEYVGLVDGKMKWKRPDRFTEGRFERDDRERKSGKRRTGEFRENGGVGGFGAPVGGEMGGGKGMLRLDEVVFDKQVRVSMGGGGQSLHGETGPVFGGGMGGDFGMGGRMGSHQGHEPTRFSPQEQMASPSGFGQTPFEKNLQAFYETTSSRRRDDGPPSSRHPQSYNPPHISSYQSRRHDFEQNPPLALNQSAFQSPFQQQRQQQQPQTAFVPPAGIVDPLATQQRPLGMYGRRAYVPGQTQLQKQFPGSQTDPEQRYKYLAELDKLRKENERRGVRG